MLFLIWYRESEPDDLEPNSAMYRPWKLVYRDVPSSDPDIERFTWLADDPDLAVGALGDADPREGEYLLFEVSRPLVNERFDVRPGDGDVTVHKRTVRHPPRPDKYIEDESGGRVDVRSMQPLAP